MNQWTHLIPIAEEPYALKPEAAKLRAEINGRIEGLLEARAQLEQEAGELSAAEAADLTSKDLKRLDAIPARRRELLIQEIAIRQEIAAFIEVRTAERIRARLETGQAYQAARDAVAERMRSAGFDEQSLIGIAIESHPEVRKARNNQNAIQSIEIGDSSADANHSAIRRVKVELDAARQRLLAGV